ncbi:uncharacterized protein LOC135131028 [Zophobas morio]|uniref:uncharacterized protein LOC135131028 n=1 Tax=Zophobas morio TaxID=2755281 RepID=UPI0030832D7C
MYPTTFINEMREIDNEYPDFYNPHLPDFVRCTGHNGENDQENLKQTFRRICPKYFYVKNVSICKRINNSKCQARVTYGMKDDKDLPLEPDLKHHVSLLLKHAPLNTVLMGEQILLELPKNVIIVYEIYCECPLKAAEQMQSLIKQFQDLQA